MPHQATQQPPDLERVAAQFNLEHFLKQLTLEPMVHTKRAPRMPARGARSEAMPLIMKPGGYRKLQEVKRIERLQEEAASFFNNLTAELDDGAEFKALSLASQVPTKKMEEAFMYNPYEVNTRHEVLFAVERGPVMSAETLVHTIGEELQGWRFHTPRGNGTLNNQGIEPMYFTKLDESHGMESVRCVVISLAPWEFTPQDFEDFTCMSIYIDGNKSINGERNSPPWRNADMMWAYLHDLCIMHDCRHFVLTTYEQWAFGGFSTYCTNGFVSDVISWDAKPNSVLEIFTYWLLTACNFRNTIMLDEVPRERHIDYDLFEKERELYGKRLLNDGITDAGPRIEIQEARPAKRACRDLIEERVGWEPLLDHISIRFPSPKKKTARVDRPSPGDSPKSTLPTPSVRWNGWQTRIGLPEKENPSKTTGQEKRAKKQPSNHLQQEFGHPIPFYSTDMRSEGLFQARTHHLVTLSQTAPVNFSHGSSDKCRP